MWDITSLVDTGCRKPWQIILSRYNSEITHNSYNQPGPSPPGFQEIIQFLCPQFIVKNLNLTQIKLYYWLDVTRHKDSQPVIYTYHYYTCRSLLFSFRRQNSSWDFFSADRRRKSSTVRSFIFLTNEASSIHYFLQLTHLGVRGKGASNRILYIYSKFYKCVIYQSFAI